MEGTKMPLTKALLNLIYRTGEIAVDFYYITHDAKYHRGAFMRGGHEYVEELERFRNKRKAYCVLQRLKYSKYVEVNKIANKLIVKLTDKGKRSALISNLNSATKCKDYYVVVIFDIPESKRVVRRQFRLLLRQGGFVKLQQSVWISKKDVYKIIIEFIKKAGIASWVKVFYGSQLFKRI